jgi:hypothetical protein
MLYAGMLASHTHYAGVLGAAAALIFTYAVCCLNGAPKVYCSGYNFGALMRNSTVIISCCLPTGTGSQLAAAELLMASGTCAAGCVTPF